VHDQTNHRRALISQDYVLTCTPDSRDTIVNFSESLPQDQLNAAVANARSADTCFVLGKGSKVGTECLEACAWRRHTSASVAVPKG